MKLVILLMLMLPLTACHISRGFQPPPYDYETYYKHKKRDTPFDIIKKDMLACGFENTYNNAGMLQTNKNKLVEAEICMEQKGYVESSTKKEGVCGINLYKDTEACQKYLRQK